jgi:hypothetical protein
MIISEVAFKKSPTWLKVIQGSSDEEELLVGLGAPYDVGKIEGWFGLVGITDGIIMDVIGVIIGVIRYSGVVWTEGRFGHVVWTASEVVYTLWVVLAEVVVMTSGVVAASDVVIGTASGVVWAVIVIITSWGEVIVVDIMISGVVSASKAVIGRPSGVVSASEVAIGSASGVVSASDDEVIAKTWPVVVIKAWGVVWTAACE